MSNITKEQLHTIAMGIALRFHLSDFDYHKSPMDTYDSIGEDEDIVVWEPFEYWEASSIRDSIDSLLRDIETTFSEYLGF